MPKKAKKKKVEKKVVKRCVTMFTDEVSVVTRGANGHQTFLMVKSDDGDIGQIVEDFEKAVPAKDATSEAKEKAQKARAKKYGIEILPKGSNLSYPKGDPTTERLYGDPVNIKYPLAYADATEPDPGRTRNALARFKQNYSAYSKAASQKRVYERIVRAAMAAGIKVKFDPKDPIDSKLPGDVKARLKKDDAQSQNTGPQGTESDGDALDLAWIDTIEKSFGDAGEDWIDSVSKVADSVKGDHGESVDDTPADSAGADKEPEPNVKSAPDENNESLDELKKELLGSKAEIDKLRKENTKLAADIGRMNINIGSARSNKPGESGEHEERDESDDVVGAIDLSPSL